MRCKNAGFAMNVSLDVCERQLQSHVTTNEENQKMTRTNAQTLRMLQKIEDDVFTSFCDAQNTHDKSVLGLLMSDIRDAKCALTNYEVKDFVGALPNYDGIEILQAGPGFTVGSKNSTTEKEI